MRKYEGGCDATATAFASFPDDLKVSVDLVNEGDCTVRVRLLSDADVMARRSVRPGRWTEEPVEQEDVKIVEFSCRRRDEVRSPKCSFAYTISAEGRHDGDCGAADAPLTVRAEFRQAVDVKLRLENLVRVVFLGRARPTAAMLPVGDAVTVRPKRSARVIRTGINVIAFACVGKPGGVCAFTYGIEAS